MTIEGGVLSTIFGPIGPAVTLLPATSDTPTLLVKALAVSVPAGTEVVRLKLACPGLANPERLSLPVQWMDTSVACHRPSGDPQLTTGGISSKHPEPYVLSLVDPPLSQARTCAV